MVQPAFVKSGTVATAMLVAAATTVIVAVGAWAATSGLAIVGGADLNVIFSIQKMLLHQPLYGDPSLPPFDITQYSPLYYYVCAALSRGLGISAHDPAGVAAVARLTSLACSVAVAGAVFGLLRRSLGASVSESVLAASAVLPMVGAWAFFGRPDDLLHLTGVLALWCGVEAAKDRERQLGWLLGGAAFATLAALTKQNGLSFFAFVAAVPLAQRRLAATVSWALFTVALFAVGALVSPWLFGEHVWQNVVDGLKQPVSIYYAYLNVYRPLVAHFGVVVALACLVSYRWWTLKREDAVAIYLMVAQFVMWGVALVTGLKEGAVVNYLHYPLVVSAVAIGAGFASPRLRVFSGADIRATTALWLVVTSGWAAAEQSYMFVYGRANLRTLQPIAAQTFAALGPVERWLTDHLQSAPDDRILSFEIPLNNFMPDKVVTPQRELADYAYRGGVIRYAALDELVRRGRLRYVVVPAEEALPGTYVGIDLSRFKLATQIGRLKIYEWQRPESAP